MPLLSDLKKIKIFADGSDIGTIFDLYENSSFIQGFTTNPSLMRKANVDNYEFFARNILDVVIDKPISFEVFADDFNEMERQARKIASWGKNVYVKIPISNTKGHGAAHLIKRLSQDGIKVNVTAIMTWLQIESSCWFLEGGAPAYISVFAGRIADTGRDPLRRMKKAVELIKKYPNIELIWASPREVLNIVQADEIGCDIITVTSDILKKLPLLGKDLQEFSLDTVKMFYDDAQKAGYTL